MMNKALLGALGVGLSLACAPAYATDFTAADMNIKFGPGGTISATFGNSGIVEGAFTDTFTFRIPADGFGSGSIITTADILDGINDTDLLSVTVNGIPLEGLEVGLNEAGFVNGIPIIADAFNTIVINGLSRGNGSYGATATFTPGPVPEPGVWALMILGFGVVGALSRYKSRNVSLSFS